MAIILITGGSGLIGQHLTRVLQHKGDEVRWLSRTASARGGLKAFEWNIARGDLDERALEDVDHIVHLSGAGIADRRWTKARMRDLLESRAGASRLLLRTAQVIGSMPKTFISASGIGHYGAITSDRIFAENDPPANDPIGRLTKDWEDAADEWSAHCRVVKLRTSVVLACDGGALPKLAAPARWGLSAALGKGSQWMPWIHIDDLVRAYQQAIADERMQGAYNANATEQPTNREFMRAVAKALHKPFWAPNVPSFMLRLALGALSRVLLEGSRTSNAKLLTTGFRFRYDRLDDALRATLQ